MPMKILHLISQHPESTGSGYYLQNLIAQVNSKGYENFLIAGISEERKPQIKGIIPQHCRFVSFDREPLDFTIPGMSDIMPYPSSRFSELTLDQLESYEKAFGNCITRAVDDFCPDIIHTHHLWIVTALARKLLPAMKIVTTCHSTDLRQFVQCQHLRERVENPCSQLDRVLALSRAQKKTVGRLFNIDKEKIDIIGGGFDAELFFRQDKQAPPPIQIVYAGKLSNSKGVNHLLKLFRDLKDTELHLHIAGSGTGNEAENCLKLAQECSNVTIHGKLTQQELSSLMRKCHVFVLPSLYEGLPLVLLEALSCGCRIITTNLPGCRELLENADEDLVEFVELPEMGQIDELHKKDIPLFCTRLYKAIGGMKAKVFRTPSPDPEKLAKVTDPFGWDSVFERIEQSYRKV